MLDGWRNMSPRYGSTDPPECLVPGYNLNGLGPAEFERLAQALVKKVVGNGSVTFGAGRDGAREATFSGKAPYPSRTDQWRGKWIFQAKFHDTDLLGVDKARRAVIADTDKELHAITQKYRHPCDNYVMITNVPLTSVPGSGTRARIENDVFAKYQTDIKNLAVWGADDVSRFLDIYPEVRTSFLHLITPGDLIAALLTAQAQQSDDTARTMQAYIYTSFEREQYAQLDQAGDVGDDPVRLQQVFFDLSVTNDPEHARSLRLESSGMAPWIGERGSIQVVRMMLAEASTRTVLVGGPGEGKSTIGQYLAQLHRATLLRKAKDIALTTSYLPSRPRIPLRVILKDYGQWLAGQLGSDPFAGSLDEYICYQIKSVTSRRIEPAELHKVIGDNPVILILDGLDEVTEPSLKKALLDRVGEFTERCYDVYDADMQVLATTRPTGYVEQFDPKKYLHLRLIKLQAPQVVDYVERWVNAKQFDGAKAARVLESIKECIADPQIKLMATTPLQVTILAVIVALGGTPPRQREALFNEYLEVIYKRETAKGKHIIQSSKEMLIGLHKYVGYILHEKATGAEATSAFLDARAYAKTVSTFLKHQNPYAPQQSIDVEHKAITKDAGDRLVLIVEPTQGRFGFELRSIQEFFAACHLLDTSKSTEQRYRRFEAISRLTHWRNVALFFAGRVGRNYEGEVFNLVEVCRDIDREGPDRYLRRGSELALEMAADRPFGSNARGQRSLIEHGLNILEADLSHSRRSEACDVLQRLPVEDVRDHVLPLLRQRVDVLHSSRLTNFVHAAYSVSNLELARLILRRMVGSPEGSAEFIHVLMQLGVDIRPQDVSLREVVREVDANTLAAAVTTGSWLNVVMVVDATLGEGDSEHLVAPAIAHALNVAHGAIQMDARDQIAMQATGLSDAHPLRWILPVATHVAAIQARGAAFERHRPDPRRARAGFHYEQLRRVILPQDIVEGKFSHRFTDLPQREVLLAPLWIMHLWGGAVDLASLKNAVAYLAEAVEDADARSYLSRYRTSGPNPVLDFLFTEIVAGAVPTAEALENVLPFAGMVGSDRWNDAITRVAADVEDGFVNLEDPPVTPANFDDFVRVSVERHFPMQLFPAAIANLPSGASRPEVARRSVNAFLDDGRLSSSRVGAWHELLRRKWRMKSIGPSLIALAQVFINERRADAPEMLTLLFPYLLGAGPDCISDADLKLALEKVGQPVGVAIDNIGDEYGAMTSDGLARLVGVLLDSSTPSSVFNGALRVTRSYCFRFLFHERRRLVVTRPRYRGFAAAHRALLGSDDRGRRSAGIYLLLPHPPSSMVDFELLDKLVGTEWDDVFGSLLQAIIDNSVLWHGNRDRWIEFLSAWLDLALPASARGAIAEELDRLLAATDQSLASVEGALGLPLQS
jgi:hypothetical protein